MRLLRQFGLLVGLVAASSPLALASLTLTPLNGDLFATALLTNGSIQLDVRGVLTFELQDPANGLPPTPITISDIANGTDTTGAVIPFGNASLVALSPASPIDGIADLVSFNFNGASFNGPVLTIPAFFSVVPAGSVPDPALTDLIMSSPLPFDFTFSTSEALGGGDVIAQFTLTPSPLPEPKNFGFLVGASLLCLVGIRIFRRA